jgi:hypothetical protein
MKTILNSDGPQFRQYHQSIKSPLTSTYCTTYDVRIQYPGLRYALKWGGVNGQYNSKVNECSELTDYYIYVYLGR